MKRITKKNESFVIISFAALCVIIGLINPVFFTKANWISLLKASIVMGIMTFGLLPGIIAGGIDVSFPAIAVCSMYLTSKYMHYINFQGSVVVPILLAMAIGAVLGLINGLIITKFDLPAFIVTLGTSSLFYGLLITSVGSKPVNRLVKPMEEFGKAEMLRVTSGTVTATISWTFLFLVAVVVIVAIMLRKTMLGRGIYAIGGSKTSAERAGFNVDCILIFVYTFIGLTSGLAGICHTIQAARISMPTDLWVLKCYVLLQLYWWCQYRRGKRLCT